MALELVVPNRRAVDRNELVSNAKLITDVGLLRNGGSVKHIGGHFRRLREFADFPLLVQTIHGTIKNSDEVDASAKAFVHRTLIFLAKNRITNEAHNRWLSHPERIELHRQKFGKYPEDYGMRDSGPSI